MISRGSKKPSRSSAKNSKGSRRRLPVRFSRSVGKTGAQMIEKSKEKASRNVLSLFRGNYVWIGIAFAVFGYLA